MTDQEWRVLISTPGAQARHQARELLAREWQDWEWACPHCVQLHRWACAVVASETRILVSEGA
jgi:hypothetical protein